MDLHGVHCKKLALRKPLEFVHITKNCGSAIEEWGKQRGFRWGGRRRNLKGPLRPPHAGKILCERFHVPPSFFEENPYAGSDTFAVCRHPVTRAISEFRCPWKGFCAPAKSAESKVKRANATAADLNAWLMAKERRGAMRPPFGNGHLIPQATYFFDDEDRPVIPADRVLRFESIERDLERLCALYELPYGPLPRVNESVMPRFGPEDLEPATHQMIRTVYKRDFLLLGYTA